MKLKIGLLGAGRLGKIHIKCMQAISAYELVGFYDPNAEGAEETAQEFQTISFPSPEALIAACDVVDIVTPTSTHFHLAAQAAKAGKHIFIEKPLTHTIAEAEELIRLVSQNNVKVQVGHVERFNPAFLALGDTPLQPMFMEAHRLANFNPRGTDVSVILDLMIHDIDIILHLVHSEVKSIHANGVAVVSDTPDIANARIEFENGCVANLTASRLSLKQMRKIRIFQPDAYISIDFLEKQTQIIRLYDKSDAKRPQHDHLMELETPKGTKMIDIQSPEPAPVNAILMELETFADAIHNDSTPIVSILDGYKALKVAHSIIDEINK